MGRDVFLTRLVLGRSSHEPPEQLPNTASQPANGADSGPDDQTPQYDERGHPVNPRARALGRALRDAQNDILAAVGVVERKRVHIAGFPLPPPKDPSVIRLVEAEDLSGTLVAIIGTLTRYAGTWWVSALHDRILTYDYPQELSFYDLVRAQLQWAGPTAFFLAGLPAQLISMVTNDGDLWASFVVQLIDDVIFRSRLSRKSRLAISRWKPFIRKLIAISIELAFAPIVLHAGYQRLFLASPSQLLPPISALNPWSASSPVQTIAFPEQFSLNNLTNWLRAASTSPVVMIITWRRAMIRIQRIMYEPLEKGILSPDNPDHYTADEASERRRIFDGDSPSGGQFSHSWSTWFFACLNWSWRGDVSRGAPGDSASRSPPTGRSHERETQGASTTNGHQSTEDRRPGTPPDATQSSRNPRNPSAHDRNTSSTSPHSISDSTRHHDDDRDATVRIASRDEGSGVVSLEIALPEELQNGANSSRRHNGVDPQGSGSGDQERRSGGGGCGSKRSHRVTQLAEEPAEMLGSWVNFTFSDWVLLPLKAVGLRMIALSYLRFMSSGNNNAPLPVLANQIHSPWWPALSGEDLTSGSGLRKLGVFAGRVGLCCSLEILFGLGLWGFECITVTVLGKKYFGWGQAR